MHNNRFIHLAVSSLLFIVISCNNGEQKTIPVSNGKDSAGTEITVGNLPVMVFKADKHDFGTITEGEKVSCVFTFKNEGKSDLLISAAQGSCGCTVPEYPKAPISPGAEGTIKVTFDSHGKQGLNKKEVLITTNCKPSTKILQIQVNVEPKK